MLVTSTIIFFHREFSVCVVELISFQNPLRISSGSAEKVLNNKV
jgi:hypothetical protein